jgi:hypothetical protein
MNPPKLKSNENEAKMHFTWSPAVLGTFKLPLKDFVNYYCKFITSDYVFRSLQLIEHWGVYIFFHINKNNTKESNYM